MYKPKLSLKETQKAIELIKIQFPQILSKELNLTRVSAPLFLEKNSCLNDGLNGEEAVSFVPKDGKQKMEVVHSLAKWKRTALDKYGFEIGEGLYADMNAIRKEELLSQYHSYYVDQWDWEKSIAKSDRNYSFLQETVKKIYKSILEMQKQVQSKFSSFVSKLPEEIIFITSQELEDLYPELSPEKREDEFARKHKAFFVTQVGHKLKSGQVHSQRAFDYDDWTLNGDLIVYHEALDRALELSSMGIRVDSSAIVKQIEKTAEEIASISQFHKSIIEETITFSIGGGIGQSRLCMFLLEKIHIGEVQASYWSEEELKKAELSNIPIL